MEALGGRKVFDGQSQQADQVQRREMGKMRSGELYAAPITRSFWQEANEIRARIEACPVHMSNVTAFTSALAANVCVAVDSSMAFCFVKDVETEQLLGAYASRHCCFPHPDCSPSETQNSSCECSHATSQARMASCVQRSQMCTCPEDTAHQRNCCSFLTREPGKCHMSGGTVHSGGPSLSGLSPQASSFFSALLAQDARASNSCLSHEEQQQEQGAASRDLPSNSACSMLQQQQTVKEASESPFNAGQNRHQENTLADTLREQGGEVAGAVTISAPPEFIVVSAESFVQYLINDLRKGCRAYCYEPTTQQLFPFLGKEQPETNLTGGHQESLSLREAERFLVACRIEDEGARNACRTMAEARVAYVGPSCKRKPSPPTVLSHQDAWSEGPVHAARRASSESVENAVGVSKTTSPPSQPPGGTKKTHTSRRPSGIQDVIPVLYSATLERPTAGVDEDAAPRCQATPSSSLAAEHDHSPVPSSPRRALSTDIMRLIAQPELRQSIPSARSVLAPLTHTPLSELPSVDDSVSETSLSARTLHSLHSNTTLGIIFSVDVKRVDAQLLLEAVAQVCAPTMALLLQQQWLRRDRFKRLLQLELHRTVFQETSIPIRMMQRLLALLHAAVGAEAAAFFIADTQNRNFICLGGHKRATGLSLSGDHCLLGEATRQRGRTAIFNFLPHGFNKEYDIRARFETKHALLVPLLNTQGHVKAVVVLLNRSECSCERLNRWAKEAEEQCACKESVQRLEPLALAGNAWSSVTAPCEKCMRRNVNELSYGEFLTRPPASLDIDYSRHFIRIHETLMRAVQYEMQHWLGGQLTSVCMAGMSLLQPMETMVSYVMGGQQRGSRGSAKPLGAVLEQIENFVSRDRRMKLLSLRRSASVAVAELQSLHGVAEVVVTQRLRSSVSGDHINKAFCSSNSLQRSISRIPVTLHDFLSLDKENLKKGQTVGMPGEEEKCLDSRSRSLFASNSLAATTGIPAKDESLLEQELSLEPYRRLDLDVWRRTADELQLFFFLALEELGVMVKSEKSGLQAFFALIRDAYHTDNPYHNFYHAMHVVQMCWLFLTRYSCKDLLTLTEQLGLMLAALAHDVDHPGVNNSSLCEEQHPLAIIYNDKAVLENHHAAFASRAMLKLGLFSRKTQNAGSSSLGNTLSPSTGALLGNAKQHVRTSPAFETALQPQEAAIDGIDDEEDHSFHPSFAEIRRVVTTCILATDMELFRYHHEAMRKRAQMKRTTGAFLNSDEDHTLLATCLIHCADISNPLLPERRNMQWASLIIQEFNAQVEMERHKGLPVTVFMDARTELLRTQSQIGFLSFVVLDQFRALSDLVPGAEELVVQGEKNLEDWQAAMDILREAERRDA
ncbi:3', 5'-cyclic nucleotide phosphodiesterase domain-containing protein, putative [Eimeria tenella]|uniref:3', 5'-cyclic nucleotide phosphodiesterase domain-containing protein, putative n=1 Tax=Eimeria tenella TaxID=5802 RepID=U6L692_EIMTE|nr:3', 5'-cyclic nucleotide phosphodiesterase domain-containing protein, putative [Eimeria tenella]CDJ43320.1 3', 5'-cyclic nucleotide phosphodiesterase domain-containing protein, putative [Eimeria tenella]|eukprot:XP_013234070.1 3', 5'-cyclic nucleotide phosphodiesterase domain-containing protein, putative [Eimeria tenella]